MVMLDIDMLDCWGDCPVCQGSGFVYHSGPDNVVGCPFCEGEMIVFNWDEVIRFHWYLDGMELRSNHPPDVATRILGLTP